MRPITKTTPIDENNLPINFTQYQQARRYLIDNIGEYCSYCERKVAASLAVEHIIPKILNPELELEWSNLLLACTNCNSTKGDKEVLLDLLVWPHLENTYILFSYPNDGSVIPADNVSDKKHEQIQNFINLVGLNKRPPDTGTLDWKTASNRTHEQRIQALIDANEKNLAYNEADTDVKKLLLSFIVLIAQHQGFWSIWMNAFAKHPEVQRELILAFKGTNLSYFKAII